MLQDIVQSPRSTIFAVIYKPMKVYVKYTSLKGQRLKYLYTETTRFTEFHRITLQPLVLSSS
jgi:uncharacterized protein with WD repeat